VNIVGDYGGARRNGGGIRKNPKFGRMASLVTNFNSQKIDPSLIKKLSDEDMTRLGVATIGVQDSSPGSVQELHT
jgi:hypothetical protein